VCAGVGLSGGRGRLLTHVHRASACTLNAVGLLPVSRAWRCEGRPPLPHHFVCVEKSTLPYLTPKGKRRSGEAHSGQERPQEGASLWGPVNIFSL